MQEETIVDRLMALRDERYGSFQGALLPTVDSAKVIGVRTPALRALAKELIATGEAREFVMRLPHRYFDENQLHAMILAQMKDYGACLHEVERFLPYVDNWATCDQLTPRTFARHAVDLLPQVRRWIASEHEYTVRFGIKMLMDHYLGEHFETAMPRWVAAVRREKYYVRMMQAWYVATALAKQWEATIGVIEEGLLERWTHNKAIQKAVESLRITAEQKELLRGMKN